MTDRITARRDPRVPGADECVVRNLLERWANEKPDVPYVIMHRGPQVSFAQIRDLATRAAAGLAELGVRQGDTVAVWLPNGLDCLRVWFGINWLGAVYVAINTAYKGTLLEHVLANADATILVTHADLLARLDGVDLARIERIVVCGGEPRPVKTAETLPATCLDGDPTQVPALERPIEPWDPVSIVYTSGTTGPSKGVVTSYAQMFAMGGPDAFSMLGADDRYLCNLPLFHVGGTIPVLATLARGASVAFAEFSTNEFWSCIRETDSSFTLLLGAMATFVVKHPAGPGDRDHLLKKVVIIPLAEDAPAFAERFGVEVYTLFNMTEISTPLVSGLNPRKSGICGKPRSGVALRIVDEHDCEVAPGATGELIVRTDAPWALNSGYYRNPEATVKAWRNGWFHTGDAFRIDEDGDYVFVDRMKDAIRRRGENISSFEVEAEVAAHPDVNECAVVAVPSEMGEDEVLCVVAPVAGHAIDPAELLVFLQPRLAHFMVPRYVRIIASLPRTPTAKIQKHILRSEGVTKDTWDREAAGSEVRRERIGAG